MDARDFLYDDEDFAGFDARSDYTLNLEDFTTRELVDELSDRLEARAKSSGAGASKAVKKAKTPAVGAPGLKNKKTSKAGASDPTAKPAAGRPVNLRKATKEDWEKLLQAVQKLKAGQGATGALPPSAAGGKGGKVSLALERKI